ncbi:MAG: hypothetical protein AAF656_07745 [Planctomycetota bacterium]
MSATLTMDYCRIDKGWTPEVDMVLSALEVGRGSSFVHKRTDRRNRSRVEHRVVGHIRLFADDAGTDAWVIYTRDLDQQGIGFVSREPLPLGFAGTVELIGPDEQPFSSACTVHRSRECAPGWYEGSLHFHNRRPDLLPPMQLHRSVHDNDDVFDPNE